jgi:ribosomal protein L14
MIRIKGDSQKMTKKEPEEEITVILEEPVPIRTRKNKKASSRSARRLEDIESRVSKSVRRVSKAVDNGVSIYLEKRDKSASKRRDGALVDFCENASVGVSKTLAESAPVLTDFAKAVNSRRVRKTIRKVVRSIPLL